MSDLNFTDCSQFVGEPVGTCEVRLHDKPHTLNQYQIKICHFTYNTYRNSCENWKAIKAEDIIREYEARHG